jgi:hypothetical protein
LSQPALGAATRSSNSAWLARRAGPRERVDDAFYVVRHASGQQLMRAVFAGVPLGTVALAFYYIERIEGLHAQRSVFAIAFVLAFLFRFYTSSILAREFVQLHSPSLPISAHAPSRVQFVSSGALAGLAAWLWAWPALWLVMRLTAFALLALLPLCTVGGAIAPSYLARSACAPERGIAAFLRAVEDARGSRVAGWGADILLLAGTLVLFANLYALGALSLFLANRVLGLDVAFLSAFLSPNNEFMALLLLSFAFLLVQPLQAALSAISFAQARGRNHGADLEAAIDALTAPSAALTARDRKGVHGGAIGLVLCTAWLASSSPARAQATEPPPAAVDDANVHRKVQRILAREEFHEFDPVHAQRFDPRDLIEKLFGHDHKDEPPASVSRGFTLRPAAWQVVTAALGLLVLVSVFVSISMRASRPPPSAAGVAARATGQAAGADGPDALHLEANALAVAGDYREAVRVLYGAVLATLDRARLIRFEKSRTNGQYVRALPAGPMREQLGSLTRWFDRAWYGHAPIERADYEAALVCAEQLAKSAEPPA